MFISHSSGTIQSKTFLPDLNFKVLNSGWNWKRYYFIVKKVRLSEYFNREGPPLVAKNNVKMFKSKHKNCFVKGKRLYAKVKREHRDVYSLVNALVKKKFVKEKVKKLVL